MQSGRSIGNGRLTVRVGGAQARGLAFDGCEVLRGLSAPVRDANWGTVPVTVEKESFGENDYHCQFTSGGMFRGQLALSVVGECEFIADVSLEFLRDAEINRAGFCLLHPIHGVAGSPLLVTHSDGSFTETNFPARISAGQPARNIAGLSHHIGSVGVTISVAGDVFEMEDQRNWSDASFKTYCRPLTMPRPYSVAAGQVVRQSVRVGVAPGELAIGTTIETGPQLVRMPQVMLAHEAGLSSAAGLERFPDLPVLARMESGTADGVLADLAGRQDVALELVIDGIEEIADLAARISAARLQPLRTVALPRGYLKTHQPEGPWPAGPTPQDCVAALRLAFPTCPVGGGSLTNFTEFNRCPPHAVDFLTFGNTAIVHAADDLSVTQTLEALPEIIASAEALVPDRPLHLGLLSIGMRSNPYGVDVLPNPQCDRLAMVRRDPRQETDFAAAYAAAVLALAAQGGVASLALAMPDGDLGAADRPLAEVIKMAHRLAGCLARVEVEKGLFRIDCDGVSITAKFVDGTAEILVAEAVA